MLNDIYYYLNILSDRKGGLNKVISSYLGNFLFLEKKDLILI